MSAKVIAMDGEPKSKKTSQEDVHLLTEKLERQLAEPIDVDHFSDHITRLLKALGRRPGSPNTIGRL
jgi:hypothetical protein